MKRVLLSIFEEGNEKAEISQSFEVDGLDGLTSWMLYLLIIGSLSQSGLNVKH